MNKNIIYTIQVKCKLGFQGHMTIRHYFDDLMSQQAKEGKLSETKTHDTCRQQLSKSVSQNLDGTDGITITETTKWAYSKT